jgi:hypothetical protein
MSRERAVVGVLGLVLLGLALYLVVGDDPWTGGVAKRLSRDQNVRAIDYARTYRWWIAGANALVVVGLLLTRRRWLGPAQVAESGALAPPARRARAWFCLGVAAAMVAGGVLAWPRLGQSFWDDEEYTVRRSVDGFYRPNVTGEMAFEEVAWRDTFLYTLTYPNNHVPFSIAARLSLGAWRALTRPSLRLAHEPSVRFPAFVAGMAAIGAMALFLRRIGYALPGLFAAWLLALHPWHLRYTSEARGYSLLLLLIPLLLLALVNALQRGTWGRWTLFGVAQVLLLWVYPGGIAILAVVNAVALCEVVRLYRRSPALREQASRWLVTSLVSAGAWAQLMLPNLLIFLRHMDWAEKDVTPRFVVDTVSHLFVGAAWSYGRLGEHYAELSDVAHTSPGLLWAAVAVTLLLMALGALRLLAAGGVRARLVAALLLPAPLTMLGTWLQSALAHPWYFIFALPSAVVFVAVGLEAAFARLRPARAAPAAAAAMALYLAGYAWISQAPREALRAGSLQPEREAVLRTRPSLDPFDPRHEKIITVSWSRAPSFYDPWVHIVESADELEALLAEAHASGRPLYVNYGRPHLARGRAPELVAMAEREDLFEPIATFYGFEPRGHMLVYRYRGGGR